MLPKEKNFCAVLARKADTEIVKINFVSIVSNAPKSLVVQQIQKDEPIQTLANGINNITSYEWSVPNASRKMLFMLTTATSENAQAQAMASASIIH